MNRKKRISGSVVVGAVDEVVLTIKYMGRESGFGFGHLRRRRRRV